jgi:GNAT superfamily N-acetyltransferase
MTEPTALARRAPPPALRAATFEDVPGILRLIGRSVAAGCRTHYDAAQRAAVYAAYAGALFLEALGPFEAVVAEIDARIAGFAQLDAASGRLRALFVDADRQGRGLGRTLLADVEARAARAGRARVHGAMSLNAVPFYARAGYHASGGPERLASMGVLVPIVRMEKRLDG